MLHNIKKDLHSRKKQATFLRFLVSYIYIESFDKCTANKSFLLEQGQFFMHLVFNLISNSSEVYGMVFFPQPKANLKYLNFVVSVTR